MFILSMSTCFFLFFLLLKYIILIKQRYHLPLLEQKEMPRIKINGLGKPQKSRFIYPAPRPLLMNLALRKKNKLWLPQLDLDSPMLAGNATQTYILTRICQGWPKESNPLAVEIKVL